MLILQIVCLHRTFSYLLDKLKALTWKSRLFAPLKIEQDFLQTLQYIAITQRGSLSGMNNLLTKRQAAYIP